MDEKKFAIKETVSAEEVKMLRKKLGLTVGLLQADCGTSGA